MAQISLKTYQDKILAEAKSEIGYTEGKNNYNKFAAELKALWVQYQAWCGTFNTAIYRRAGIRLEKLISNPYYVPTMVSESKKKGIYTTNPEPGDLALFDWQSQTWDGDHTGIYVGNGYTIEGNTSPSNKGSQGNGGGVWQRKRPSRHIIGYISLSAAYKKFPEAFGTPTGKVKFEIWESSNTIKSLSREQVKDIQTKLVKAGHTVGASGIDGSYKGDTVKAVIAFQNKHGLIADGVAGPATQKKLNEVVNPIVPSIPSGGTSVPAPKPSSNLWETNKTIKNMSSAKVKELQSNLVKLGFSVGSSGVDGSYKTNTIAAVKAFQKKHGLAQDGIAGPATQKKINELLKPAPAKKPAPSKIKAPAFPLPKGFVYLNDPKGSSKYVSGRVKNSKVPGDVVKDSNERYYSKGLKQWQAQMKKRGWNIQADGRFGDETAKVALQFKQNYGIGNDSRIGIQTWTAAWEQTPK